MKQLSIVVLFLKFYLRTSSISPIVIFIAIAVLPILSNNSPLISEISSFEIEKFVVSGTCVDVNERVEKNWSASDDR